MNEEKQMEEVTRILIVEDVRIVALEIEKRLCKAGYQVAGKVTSAEEAIETVEQNGIDLILMDISLAGQMDGIEGAEHIRKRSDIPVIFLSAHSDKKTLERAKKAEPFGYIVKPFDQMTLQANIEMAVYKHRMKKKLAKTEDERDRLLAQRENAGKMEALGTLAGGVAHHMNNLLSVIIGYTEMAMNDLPGESSAAPLLEEAIQGGFRARDMIQQITTFAGSGMMDLHPVCAGPLISKSLRLLWSTAPSNIELNANIVDQKGMVNANASLLNQVLLNLCRNAIDAMKETGGVLEVKLEEVERNRKSFLALTVSDTGHGMNEEVVKRVFEPFFTTRPVDQGTGMGLAVVHGIVRGLDGEIVVESQPGKGSVFRVFFPKSGSQTEPEEKKYLPAQGGKERILLVDDEDAMVAMFEQILDRFGYTVTGKTDPKEALAAFKAAPDNFDLLIADLIMPGMNGDELARRVLEIKPQLPVVVCTGYSDRISKDSMHLYKTILMKPVPVGELAGQVRKVLDEQGK